jgi:hypothetical protein
MINEDLEPTFEWFAKKYKDETGSKVSKKELKDIARWLMYSWAAIDNVRYEMPEQYPELVKFRERKNGGHQ